MMIGKRIGFLSLAMALPVGDALAVENQCAAGETVVWSCKARHKVFSVCASADVGKPGGYMQYRAGVAGHPGFAFPAGKRNPSG